MLQRRGFRTLTIITVALALGIFAGERAVPALGPSALVPSAQAGNEITSIYAGDAYGCAVLKGGIARCWGWNSVGRSASPYNMGDYLITADLGTRRSISALATGWNHACALLDNGSMKCWGGNSTGELGIGDRNNRGDDPGEMGNYLPAVNLGTGTRPKILAAGGVHTCAVLIAGTVKCWGNNFWGQLGTGDTNTRGDELNEMGNSLPTVGLGTRRKVRAIGAGYGHTCAILDNGSMKCWGWNNAGQLGYGDTINRGDGSVDSAGRSRMGAALRTVDLGSRRRVKAISGGLGHTCAILDNGTVKCWGNNEFGQLGYGDTKNRGDDPDEMGNNLPTVNLGTGRTARTISTFGNSTCAILDNGSVKCWGFNLAGQLGYGDTANRGDDPGEMGNNLPTVDLGSGRTVRSVRVGVSHACALLVGNAVKCWGYNYDGALGSADTEDRGDEPNEMGDNLPELNLGVRVGFVGSGFGHSCAILANRSVECWGGNSEGQLGYGDTLTRGDEPNEMGSNLPTVNLGTARSVRTLAMGPLGNHTCGVLDDRTVKCWGNNDSGQLGYGDVNNRGDEPNEMGDSLFPLDLGTRRRATSLAVGASHTCSVLDNNTLKCWGNNDSGQLGYGDTLTRGDAPNEMGNNLPAVNLGTGQSVRAVAAGHNFTCAILNRGTVKCWGMNDSGQLGYGDTLTRGDAPNEMGNNLPAVNLGAGRRALAIAAGGRHACALLSDRTVKCWGDNGFGQLAQADIANRGDNVGEMGGWLLPISLGFGRTARAIAVGNSTTCVVLDNNSVKCWGDNQHGELGQGDTKRRGDGHLTVGDLLDPIDVGFSTPPLTLSVGARHACALLVDRSLRCWGFNQSGQLGQGDVNNRGDQSVEMGPFLKPVTLTG